jgi:hypothetical protein
MAPPHSCSPGPGKSASGLTAGANPKRTAQQRLLPPGTGRHKRAAQTARAGTRQQRLTHRNRVRDEEVVGSNPATPTATKAQVRSSNQSPRPGPSSFLRAGKASERHHAGTRASEPPSSSSSSSSSARRIRVGSSVRRVYRSSVVDDRSWPIARCTTAEVCSPRRRTA